MCGEGLASCPILYHNSDSCGSELFGIYCIIAMAKVVIEYQKIKDGSLFIACDNDASLLSSTSIAHATKIDPTYFDIIWEISDLLKTMPIKVKKKYVKGHAEDFKLYLNRYEKLNILMDKRSKRFRRHLEDSSINHAPIHLGSKFYSIWIDNMKISSKIDYNLKDHIHGSAMRRKLVDKGDVASDGIKFIDWKAIAAAGKNLTAYERLWVAKFTSGFCGTVSQLHFRYVSKKEKEEKTALKTRHEIERVGNDDESKNKCIEMDEHLSQWNTDLCPLCSLTTENTKHVIQCTLEEAADYRQKQFLLFTTWLTSQRSDLFFRDCVSMVLKSERSITFFDAMRQIASSKLHIEAAREQDSIGWFNFLFGRLSKK